jgi:hypothetical protein
MTLPKYLTKPEDSPQKKGMKREITATRTIASGRFFEKGDIKVKTSDDEYVVDTKEVVTQKSYTISLRSVDKLYKQVAPKTPVLMIYIGPYLVKAIIERQ